jgi:hypothetical protein
MLEGLQSLVIQRVSFMLLASHPLRAAELAVVITVHCPADTRQHTMTTRL